MNSNRGVIPLDWSPLYHLYGDLWDYTWAAGWKAQSNSLICQAYYRWPLSFGFSLLRFSFCLSTTIISFFFFNSFPLKSCILGNDGSQLLEEENFFAQKISKTYLLLKMYFEIQIEVKYSEK